MNKFRDDLHSVMFRQDVENGRFMDTSEEDLQSKEKDQEKVKRKTKKQLDALQTYDIENPDFSDVKNEVVTIAAERGGEDFDDKKSRFEKRVKDCGEMWTENIKYSRESLRQQLENGYFKNYSEDEKREKLIKVLTLYHEKVKNQYLEYVWDAEPDKFEDNKNILFTAQFTGNPAKDVLDYIAHEAKKPREVKRQVYEVKPSLENDESSENIKTSKRIKFLAHELPNYLWEVKDLSFFQDIHNLFIDRKSYIPSQKDKDQIEYFINMVDKLEGDNPELALIEVFTELKKSATNDEIEEALSKKNIQLKEKKYISDVKKAFDFYKSTQVLETSVENQHLLYLSILQIIKNEGGFDGAIRAFKKDVENNKSKKSLEKKDYKNGKKLEKDNSELKSLAEKLGISDFTSATRLNEKNTDYFNNTDVVDILADINNDGVMTYADKGLTKTGLQFKHIYHTIDVGEEIALQNLLDQAKLLNKVLNLGINDEEITADKIKDGNTKVILLLQSIIANPGEDLITLMKYGPDGGKKYDELQLQKIRELSEEYARKLLKDIDISALSGTDEVISPEGLHQAVAGALYTEYINGVGIGGRISFDEWAKGITLNGGIQSNGKSVDIGLNLAYNREISLNDGWSITPGGSAGFVSILKNPLPTFSGGTEVARQWLRKNGVETKLGGKISYTRVGIEDGLNVFSASIGIDRDKLSKIEGWRKKTETEINEKIITPILENLGKSFESKDFDLNDESNINTVENVIQDFIDKLPKKDKKKIDYNGIQKIKTNIIRLLANYNNADISDSNVRKYIATKISKHFSYVLYEQRIKDLDGKTYLSYAKLGLSIIIPDQKEENESEKPNLIYVPNIGIGVKTHNADIYGDREWNNYIMKAETGKEWDQEMINKFNENLPEEAKFKLKDGYILIPYEALDKCDIRINPGMQGLIKKDNDGILLSPKTFMTFPSMWSGAASVSYLILIGGGTPSLAENLKSKIGDESWFTEDDIDEKKLTGREIEFTMIELNDTLKEIQKEIKERDGNEDDVIHNWTFDPNILEKLQKGKSNKIVLTNNNGNIERDVKINEDSDNETLQIEYKRKKQIERLMDDKAQTIAKKIYGEANKVTTNTLYSISHDIISNGRIIHHKWPEYVNFAEAVKAKEYTRAKDIIINLLPKMDNFINKKQRRQEYVNFSNIINDLNSIDDDVALGQAMLSINNIFARVPSVRGGKENEYYFQKYVGGNMADVKASDIIGPRGEEIKKRINNNKLNELEQEEKESYLSLVDAMSGYVKSHPDQYNKTSWETETLNNAVGFNLGNAISLETPLFNPEIYKGSVIALEDLNFDGKDTLQKRLMKKMLEDKSLIGPVLKALHVDVSEIIDLDKAIYDNGKITIDIGSKNVTFSADMSFGYFSQCVNHMVILDNIRAFVEGKTSVNFKPQVSGNADIYESVLKTVPSTRSIKGEVSFRIDQTTEPETPTETPTPTSTPTEDPITGTPTSTPGEDIIGEGDEGGGDLPGEGEGL